MAVRLDYKPTRYEGKGFLGKIYLIMKATTSDHKHYRRERNHHEDNNTKPCSYHSSFPHSYYSIC